MDGVVSAGIDIGGTKTHVLVKRNGEILADEIVPTESWRRWQVEPDAEALATLAVRVCGGAAPAALGIGAHGCDSDRECSEFEGAMARWLPSLVKVVNDAELLVPAAGYASGVGVVAGTGSIAVARDGDGRMLAAGGWGWVLGDEGSASGIVREAARAVRGAIDRGERGDLLIDRLLAEYGIGDATRLGRTLSELRGAAAWGRHADVVFAAAAAGSALARRVIVDGGRALGDLVGVLKARGAEAEVVVAGGGVITEQTLLLDSFRARVGEISPASEVVLLRAAPVVGAVAIAERLLQSQPTAASANS
jgi:N-acetylglucosamine kinase-like BadF-type ATPase